MFRIAAVPMAASAVCQSSKSSTVRRPSVADARTRSYIGETDNGTRSMTPLQRIREDPEKLRDMLAARGFEAPLDRILELDRRARELRAQVEALNAERNRASRGGPPSDDVKARM